MPDAVRSLGDVVAGKYRIEEKLGTGGMGYVVGARHIAIGERVAIKILHPDAAQDADSVARFFREARTASRIRGDHVVRVLDVGKLEDETPYLVMERLEGVDLSTLIKRDGVLSVRDTIDYVLQACEALAEAHAVGIVHRDVKPSNLFLTRRIDGSPCLKILDFGISKAMAPVDANQPDFGMTRTQSVLGSPQYMAPEQMRSSRRVDGRTDIWAVGTILYELLTGESPFVAATMPELFAMILTDPTPSLRAKRPEVPEAVDLAMQRCMEKEPDKRYPNILEVARALAPYGSAPGTELVERIARVTANAAASVALDTARTSSVDIPPAPPTPTDPLALTKTTVDPQRDRMKLALIAGGFAVLAIASGVIATTLISRGADASPSGRTAAAPSSAPTVASAVEPVSLPSPPSTSTEPESSSAPAAAATPHASVPKKTRHAAPPPTATTAAAPPASTAAPPPKPPPTATSRYD